MAAVPLALLALSSVGPWGVAATVGRSQTALLLRDLPAGGDGAALGDVGRASIRSRLGALQDVDELDRVLPFLSEEQRAEVAGRTEGKPDQLLASLTSVLGLDYGQADFTSPAWGSFSAGQASVIDLRGFDRAVIARTVQNQSAVEPRKRAGQPVLTLDNGAVVIEVDGVIDRFSVFAAVKSLTDDKEDADSAKVEELAPPAVDLVSASGRRVRAIITAASWEENSLHPVSLSATFLLRSADWPASFGGG